MADTYIYRTPTETGEPTKWTYCGWFKRTNVGVRQNIVYATTVADGGASIYVEIQHEATGNLVFQVRIGGVHGVKRTNRLFRDEGAWYHFLFNFDSTLAEGTDRMQIWVNGVRETSFETDTHPAVDDEVSPGILDWLNRIGGGWPGAGPFYWQGCMSHVHFCDGYVYDSSSFGEFDATSGIWKIKTSPSVTYGTNGYFLKMEDRANLDLDSGTNAFTMATGGTLTATYDNPSNSFAVMNGLDSFYQAATFTQGNLTITTGTPNMAYNTGTMGMSAGLWYWEMKDVAAAGGGAAGADLTGIAEAGPLSTTDYVGSTSTSYSYHGENGKSITGGTQTTYGDTWTTDDIIGVYLDLTANKLYFAKNGTLQNSGTGLDVTAPASTASGVYLPAANDFGSTRIGTYTFNFGNGYFGTTAVTSAVADAGGIGAFEYDPSAGSFDSSSKDFRALCTKNIKAYGG